MIKTCRSGLHQYELIKGSHKGCPQCNLRRTGGLLAYRKFKKLHCEYCQFIPIDSCQLDVDHIDGNHSNNDPSNLQTLCANCHRLKTKLSRNS